MPKISEAFLKKESDPYRQFPVLSGEHDFFPAVLAGKTDDGGFSPLEDESSTYRRREIPERLPGGNRRS
jgi:hypothetical protein